MGEFWELWELDSVPVEVWELWGLDLSCLSRFGSSRRAGCLTALSAVSRPGGSPKEPLTRGISTLGELWELRGSGRGLWESSRSCGRALGEVWELSGRGVGVGEWWEGVEVGVGARHARSNTLDQRWVGG